LMKSRTPRALVVAPQPFFSPRGTPFSVYYRTMMLAEAGVEMDLLTYGEGADVDIPGVRILRTPRFARLGPVPIGPSVHKLFLDVFIFARMVCLLCRNRYAFVHAHEEAVFFALFLKPAFRFRLVYDMHSSLPQQLSNFSYTSSRAIAWIFRKLEDRALRVAEAVITICPDLRDYALARVPDPARHFLIENSIYEPVRLKEQCGAAPAEDRTVMDDLPGGRRLVVYAGTLEAYQGIDILIRAFASVVKSCPDAFLVIVGGTAAQVSHYRELAALEGVAADVHIRERVSQAAARACTRAAAVQVSPRSAGTNTPLKTYEQLDSGIPLVATRIHSHTQVLTDEVAYLADPAPAAMAEAVVRALSDGRVGNPRAAAARRLYAEQYSRPVYERKIHAMLKVLGVCAA